MLSNASLAEPRLTDVSSLEPGQSLAPFMAWLDERELSAPQTPANWQNAAQSDAWRAMTTTNLGFYHFPVWTRLHLHNPTQTRQTVLLYNSHPGMGHIDVTQISQVPGKSDSFKHWSLGLMMPVLQQPLPHRLSTLVLHFNPGETITLYSRLKTRGGSYQLDWHFSNSAHFSRISTIETLFLGIFGGLILFLVLYNHLILQGIKSNILGPYTAFALLSLLYQYTSKGVMRFDPTGWVSQNWLSFSTWVTPFLILIALTLVTMHLFQTKKALPRVHQVLRGAITIYLLVFLFHLSGAWFPDLKQYAAPGVTVAFLGFILPSVVGLIALYHRLPGAGFYLAGQVAVGSGHLVQIFLLTGLVDSSPLFKFSIPIGMLLDIFLLTFAFSRKLASERQQTFNQQQLFMAQSRFASLGQAFGSIAYEWKVPLVQLGSRLTQLEAYLWHYSPAKLSSTLPGLLNKMQAPLQRLSHTIETFRHFYRVENTPSDFDASTCLKEVLTLLEGKKAWSMVTIQTSTPETLPMHSYRGTLSQVLMLLLDPLISVWEPKEGRAIIHVTFEKLGDQVLLRIRTPRFQLPENDQSLFDLNLETCELLVTEQLKGRLKQTYNANQWHVLVHIPAELAEEGAE
ncbi:MAG: 7TM diverse intracellular signaling domain-containing protein [Hydrogenovibrio sp.]|uniref:7TM diverse intracellular signaling domain-containing protein n=1 Tax=Hydrogenovibrio sp. TaxID=2065821 RepID=UPI0028708E07|nr:7TM diverse intracellular signaling domain-containing protein [Hydrogenovibrio sp.]MDR9498762.1 7TM diverse intracellular signaling domain-containing protein [Hydrogenovibrio sp.]